MKILLQNQMTANSEPKISINSEQRVFLEELIHSADEQLISAGQDSANKAFNLGCTAGLIPALLIIGLTLIITKGSWIASVIMSILMIMGVFAFANFSAFISRSNAYKRCFTNQIKPEIDTNLEKQGIDPQALSIIAAEILPEDATLNGFLDADEYRQEDFKRNG